VQSAKGGGGGKGVASITRFRRNLPRRPFWSVKGEKGEKGRRRPTVPGVVKKKKKKRKHSLPLTKKKGMFTMWSTKKGTEKKKL